MLRTTVIDSSNFKVSSKAKLIIEHSNIEVVKLAITRSSIEAVIRLQAPLASIGVDFCQLRSSFTYLIDSITHSVGICHLCYSFTSKYLDLLH